MTPPEIRLRPLEVDDAEAMVEVLADPSLYDFTGDTPPSRDELDRRYAAQVRGRSGDGAEEWLNFIIVAPGGQPVGYVQATIPAAGGAAEIAWVVGAPWQGRGVGTRAAGMLVELLAHRGVTRLVAHIHPEHLASERIAAKLGFRPTDAVVDGERRWLKG